MSISELFRSDPTRRLEEVQKVNARERAATDVAEFYETESAKRVLTELGAVVRTHPGEAARFLYFQATFGSGKTHLLKLIGFVVDSDATFTQLGETLAKQWPGFDTLARSVKTSHVDRLKPVFLNLLDRDASKEPPLPFLVFEAIGRELGYPTDPNWLLEWAWHVDMEYDGVWDAVTDVEYDGRTFEDVLEERASLRRWLYEALPSLPETAGTDLDSSDGVKASIERAAADVEPSSFDPPELVQRVETVTDALNESGPRTELLLGLDEVALFVGDSRQRYREFEATMEALQHGPNPVVVTTGQYSLSATRESLVGEPADDHWTHQQVPLEGADTEIIVRKRWLQKSSAGREQVSALVGSMPSLELETYSPVGSVDPDPVESYPFREYDLTLLRMVMQELITQGRATDRDYIQGRALLVLVRSLFTKFGWARANEGALVTWDELFDLLVEETTYIPLWVQEMLENTLIPTFEGNSDAWEVRVSKALYLLNQTPAVPATPENLGRLLVDDVDSAVDETIQETESALQTLVDKRKVLTETNDNGDEEYTLVSEDQESILSRAQTRAEQISPHQLSAWVEARLREHDDFLRSDSSRHEVDVGDERLVPLRYAYSVLDSVDRAPTTVFDAVRIRVLADDPETVTEQVETWKAANDGRAGGEHVLLAIEIPEATLDRIRNVLGMGAVLDEETETHTELEREHRSSKRQLEATMTDLLERGAVHTVREDRGERAGVLDDVVEEQVGAVFGDTRRVLSKPLRAQDDAKRMAAFFRERGQWPLSESDAVVLGVDTSSRTISDSGWCRTFIDEYEPQKAIDVESLLQQTRIANGAFRGTPRESLAALLITLATSTETVALKHDTEYVTDPTEIGRQVSTKRGLTSLQVRFDAVGPDPKQIRTVVSAILGHGPAGDDPDAWVDELGVWVDEHSVLVKRTFKGVAREFDRSLTALENALSPAYSGGEITTAALVEDGVASDAETFADARELFGVDDGEQSLWAAFEATGELLASQYPNATVTSRLQTTAESGSVPTKETLTTRITDATNHRVDILSAQYRRLTGETTDESAPASICVALTTWVREHEATIHTLLDAATETFGEVSVGSVQRVFETAWDGNEIAEGQLVAASVRQQAETYATVRELLDGEPSPWAQLESAGRTLRADHPDSPTTDAVTTVLDSTRPPSPQRVQQLVADAADPEPPGPDDDVWTALQRLAEELRQELPNATITDDVTTAVDAADRPTEQRAETLLTEAETVLERIRTLRETLDEVGDDGIVRIDRRESEDD